MTDQPAADFHLSRLPRWEIIALVLGDILAVLIFVIIGRLSHRMVSAEGNLLAIINTGIPFAIAWVLVGIATGQYRPAALHPVMNIILRTLLTGVLASPLGGFLRSVWLGEALILSFLLVATSFSTLTVGIYRLLWARLRKLWWHELR